MIALALAFAALWIMMVAAPATPFARLLARCLVDAPARRLAAVRQATIIALLLAVGLAAAAWAIDYELLRMLAMSAPEAAIWLSTVEIGTLVDVGVAALAARSAVRIAAVRAFLPRRRTRRAARPPRSAPGNDDDNPALAA